MTTHLGPDIAGRRIGLLTASASRLGGGVFEAVAAHAALLRELGAEPVIVALRDRFSADDAVRFGGCEVRHVAVQGPRMVGYAPDLGAALDAAELDLLHLHGIWMYPSHAAARWAQDSDRPYLISPHGMLDPWITRRGRWKKSLARLGYERRSWHRASAFHALTAQEAADIRKEAGRKQTLVIANPGPEPAPMPVAGRAPTILYLGRIHPKKNLEALVRAWSLIGAFPSQARLVIAGWGEPRDVAALQESLRGAPPGIAFVGPQFGPDKARLLSEARFMILPSLSEGLPVAILESWAAGTPVLMSSECNLPIGFEQGAAIDCGMDSASIAAALHRALTIGEGEWLAMARAANRLAQGPFSRAAIARQWQRAYASLIANTAAT